MVKVDLTQGMMKRFSTSVAKSLVTALWRLYSVLHAAKDGITGGRASLWHFKLLTFKGELWHVWIHILPLRALRSPRSQKMYTMQAV